MLKTGVRRALCRGLPVGAVAATDLKGDVQPPA